MRDESDMRTGYDSQRMTQRKREKKDTSSNRNTPQVINPSLLVKSLRTISSPLSKLPDESVIDGLPESLDVVRLIHRLD